MINKTCTLIILSKFKINFHLSQVPHKASSFYIIYPYLIQLLSLSDVTCNAQYMWTNSTLLRVSDHMQMKHITLK